MTKNICISFFSYQINVHPFHDTSKFPNTCIRRMKMKLKKLNKTSEKCLSETK